MDKFKMDLTWHNCKTCPPEEDYNPCIIYTDGDDICSFKYWKKYGFPIAENVLHNYWWTDIRRTIRESTEFKELVK